MLNWEQGIKTVGLLCDIGRRVRRRFLHSLYQQLSYSLRLSYCRFSIHNDFKIHINNITIAIDYFFFKEGFVNYVFYLLFVCLKKWVQKCKESVKAERNKKKSRWTDQKTHWAQHVLEKLHNVINVLISWSSSISVHVLQQSLTISFPIINFFLCTFRNVSLFL